jgi:RimJ/RimL family protein N-acetyltransferase
VDRIETKRLVLRRACPADVEAMHRVLGDPRAMRFWSSLPHADPAQTEAWLAGMISAPAGLADDYLIERDGAVIGKAGCWRLPEIGFILHPDHWGQGLAFEALSAVVAAMFARHPIAAITADVDPRNSASLGLLTKLGFRRTGTAERTFRLGEEWCDSVYLALERSV